MLHQVIITFHLTKFLMSANLFIVTEVGRDSPLEIPHLLYVIIFVVCVCVGGGGRVEWGTLRYNSISLHDRKTSPSWLRVVVRHKTKPVNVSNELLEIICSKHTPGVRWHHMQLHTEQWTTGTVWTTSITHPFFAAGITRISWPFLLWSESAINLTSRASSLKWQ